MDFTKGLAQLKNRANGQIDSEAITLKNIYDKIRKELSDFVSSSGGAYKSLQSFSYSKDIPQRDKEPGGFFYGVEQIPNVMQQGDIYFPLLYTFNNVGATAIEESSKFIPCFFNFALRSIISYPLGDSIVYFLDSNVSGDFNSLSPICTELENLDSPKNMFHYVTSEEEKDKTFTELATVMNRNIRNYISKYPDLCTYNRENSNMREPYHFLFVNNIEETITDKRQIDTLIRLVHAHNAAKAGIFIFFTYNKKIKTNNSDSYFSETYKAINNLLQMSSEIKLPELHDKNAKWSLEPKASTDIIAKVIKFVETQSLPVTIMSFKDEIEHMLSAGDLWNPPFDTSDNRLLFPVGFQNAATKKEIEVSFAGKSPHFFVGGRTGTGKSILLHNLILNGALRYSPKQLQFYLVDMKGGMSFVGYKHLPHVSALCASSSRHYAESLLEVFYKEIERRQMLFKLMGVPSLSVYNKTAAREKKDSLPYVFGIIDEFQELFTATDSISNQSQKYIERIHRTSRSVGVFLALCTQTPPSNVDRSQVGIKMTLACDRECSNKLIGNEGAAKLRGVGRAIVNTSENGDEKHNQEFQVAFIDEKKELPFYVEQIRNNYLKQCNGKDELDHLIFDDNDLSARLSDNPKLRLFESQRDSRMPYIYIGVPGFYRKEHVKFCFHRDSQSNVAICGTDRQTALRLVGIISIQFLLLYKQIGARVYICDLQKQIEETYNKLDFLSHEPGVKYGGSINLKNSLEEVYNILNMRKQSPADSVNEPEVLFSILDIKPDGSFSSGNANMFSFSGTQEKTPMIMLKDLIEEGPNYGIHVLVYGYNYSNLEFLQNQSLLNNMEIKIALRGGKSSKLLINYGTQDIIDCYGKGFIKMPEEMGLKYLDGDSYGDPFLIYDTLGEKKLKGTVWDTLFSNLKNKLF